ncbi:MAG: DsrE/DsrF/TusD sulfur relay family protein [Candidatus Hydrothermarchaeales archaeon]
MSSDSLAIIANQAPYVGERAWNALRLGITALAKDIQVKIFLIDDGIYIARKRQSPPEGTPNLEELLKRAIDMGAEVKVCGTCVDSRGFAPESEEFGVCYIGKREGGLTPGDLIDGVEMGSMMDLTDWIMNNDKVVSF